VAERIHVELAGMLLREVKDPRVKNVVITKVEVTPDLRTATIFVSRYGNAKEDEAEIHEGLEGLERAKGFLQRAVASRLQLKRAPRLTFEIDRAVAYGDQIDRLLHGLQDDKAASEES
jgi:ribosome-binding factor A